MISLHTLILLHKNKDIRKWFLLTRIKCLHPNCKPKQRFIKHTFSYNSFFRKFFKSLIFIKFSVKNGIFLIFIYVRIVDLKIKVIWNWILPSWTNFLPQNCASKSIFFCNFFFGMYFFIINFFQIVPNINFSWGKTAR